MKSRPTPAEPVPQRALPHGAVVLITLGAAVVVLAGIWLARDIVGPLALATVIVIICHPVRHPLERRGWPAWAATTAVIVVAYLILAVMALLLWVAGTRFVALVNDEFETLRESVGAFTSWLEQIGLDADSVGALASQVEPSALLGVAASLAGALLAIALAFGFVLAYVIFMAADAARYSRAELSFGSGIRPTVARFRSFNRGVRRYYVVNASFGAVVAIIDGLALWALGVPAPLVWAILAFVTNFIPNIGFVIGLVPPAVLALVVGGWPLMLAVVAVYCVVNVTLQVMIQPKFVSDAVDLSLTLSFFSVIFWTFVIGPLGAILSIPLTLLVRSLLLGRDPNQRWLRWLSGERTASSP